MTDLVKRLRDKSAMIHMGEKIAWGSETALMDAAADRIEALERERDELRKALDPFSFASRFAEQDDAERHLAYSIKVSDLRRAESTLKGNE